MTKAFLSGFLVLAMAASAWSDKGVATVLGTAPGSAVKGTVRFEDSAAGLQVTAQLTGVPAGPHGFHIHEFGDCSDLGKAAGGHYNPTNTPHGDVLKAGPHHAHVGDLGNIIANEKGEATLTATLQHVTLSGNDHAVGGRAVILHEKVDDFSQPTGNAGGRIGCGSILLTSH